MPFPNNAHERPAANALSCSLVVTCGSRFSKRDRSCRAAPIGRRARVDVQCETDAGLDQTIGPQRTDSAGCRKNRC